MSSTSLHDASGPGKDQPGKGKIGFIFLIVVAVLLVTGLGWAMLRSHYKKRRPQHNTRSNATLRRPVNKKGIPASLLDTFRLVVYGDKMEHRDSDEESCTSDTKAYELGVKCSVVEVPQAVHVRDSPVGTRDDTNERGARPQFAQENNQAECPVCMQDFVDKDNVRVLPCEHRFHQTCIDRWLLDVSGTCPVCRVDFKAWGVATESADNHDRDNDKVKQQSSANEIEVN
ncbi:hypothetical protein H2202_008675 [Exophiala xenobiotica]|nr:hypothetical protein H2202_008675 [Exophiala xenobiotica]KAK5207215.1 hypothetical protein LTR41_007284 [Exophiala xenobiotica]KAK5218354.1 hypothetical protein LTR72_008957 [Exophiala xenobiotica]KAK5228850.1 hypothetical protein LTR47_008265 [Exophiala xenobiotica]KAK5253327.1 hypothetical protein LTS06_002291 [Exophiala xenobiotica]